LAFGAEDRGSLVRLGTHLLLHGVSRDVRVFSRSMEPTTFRSVVTVSCSTACK